jgi:branched-chain amino acid transport system ATP-binding protein
MGRVGVGLGAALLSAYGNNARSAPAAGPTVAVVGGGIAGLNTTYLLAKAGFQVTLYEGSNHVGGRIQTAIGQVAEGRQIFPTLSVAENLEMGGLLPRARAKAKHTIEEVFALFPRLAERRSQLAGTLSGGEQQMLAIGRCHMGQPELIMFDEPSLGLAPTVVQEVFHIIRTLNARGITILLVEQNVAVSLKISASAYVLENGRIAMSGTGEALLHDDRVRQAYMGL